MPLPATNTFAGNPLDRAGDLRNDPRWLAEQAERPDALALMLWEGRPLIEEHADGPRLTWLPLPHARDLVSDRELFLGLWKEAPVFAMEFEGSIDPTTGPAAGLGAFIEMREAGGLLSEADAAMAGAAKSLFDWRRRHGFCAACGIESENACGGWKRICPACGVTALPADAGTPESDLLPEGAITVANESRAERFEGAGPPPGDGQHRYVFTVSALNVESLDLPGGCTPAVLGFVMRTSIIARAQLVTRSETPAAS